jgi:hypothetical protein
MKYTLDIIKNNENLLDDIYDENNKIMNAVYKKLEYLKYMYFRRCSKIIPHILLLIICRSEKATKLF